MAEGDVKPPATLGRDHSPQTKKSKAPWIIGGIVIISGIAYFLLKKKKTNSSSTSTGVTNYQVLPVTTKIMQATTGSTGQSLYSDWFNQMSTLSQQINSLKTTIHSSINAQTASNNLGSTRTTIPNNQQPSLTFGKNLQLAPTPNTFGYNNSFYTPISYSKTVTALSSGQAAYFKTGTMPVKIPSVSAFKSIEHTGTHKFPQYTSYAKAA